LTARKRVLWVAALTLVLALVALIASRRNAQLPRAEDAPIETQKSRLSTAPNVRAADPPPRVAPVDSDASTGAERVRARARRDALRAQIIDARSSAPATTDRERRSTPVAVRARPSPADDPDRPGELVDRVGGRSEQVAHLNREFMPLARDCIQQAQERSPDLRGVLTLQVETVSDEHLGAVVERAEVAASSAVQERELAECIRENAMSMTFPPPLSSGSDRFELTLRVEPAASEERR
jgi:hypothetical protein